jgi:hypothetical protein
MERDQDSMLGEGENAIYVFARALSHEFPGYYMKITLAFC